MDQRKQTGRQGEEIATSYLISQGYQIIERNWRCSSGELDIIATQEQTLVFVEVRSRTGRRFGSAEESVTPTKQARLIELAQTYLQKKAVSAQKWRIDVITVQLGRRLPQIKHIENAVGW